MKTERSASNLSDRPLIAYFNGLGRGKPNFREDLILATTRRRFNVYRMKTDWFADTPFDQQLEHNIELIDRLATDIASRIILVGVSAGASHAINVYKGTRHPDVVGVVAVCGRMAKGDLPRRDLRTLDRMAHLRSSHRASPAFVESVRRVETEAPSMSQEQLDRIVSVHHRFDEFVPASLQVLPGSREHRILMPGHGLGAVAAGLMLPRIIEQHFGPLER